MRDIHRHTHVCMHTHTQTHTQTARASGYLQSQGGIDQKGKEKTLMDRAKRVGKSS